MTFFFLAMNESADVIKKHICPACRSEEVMRFRHRDENMEASCPRCGKMVRWESSNDMATRFFSGTFDYEQPELTP